MWYDVLKACPQNHIFDFVVGSQTLHVNIKWLANFTIIGLFHRYGATCPMGPIAVDRIDFARVASEALGLQSGLGAKWDKVWVREPLPKPPPAPPGDAANAGRTPWIEDLNLRPPFKGHVGPGTSLPDVGNYRLHYPSENGSEVIVDIVCGGPPQGPAIRTCDRNAPDYGGLRVNYSISQTQLPLVDEADATSVDPITEPGAVLQFEMRLRAWILDLARPPSDPR